MTQAHSGRTPRSLRHQWRALRDVARLTWSVIRPSAIHRKQALAGPVGRAAPWRQMTQSKTTCAVMGRHAPARTCRAFPPAPRHAPR
jgi:hypothetical protein